MIKKIFLDHPASVDETYFSHMLFGLRFSARLLFAGIAAFIHALIPCTFQKTASNIIAKIVCDLNKGKRADEFNKKIESSNQ